jgi:hypothetical protein
VCGPPEKKNSDDFKLGAIRWKSIKLQFRSEADINNILQVPDPPEQVPAQLLRAVVACKNMHPDRSLLQCFLGDFGIPNKTTMIGLVKLMLSLNPRLQKQLPSCLDFLRYVVRMNLRAVYPELLSVLAQFFDETLCAAFDRGGLQPLQFLRLHLQMSYLVLHQATVDQVVAADGVWERVEAQLNTLVASSPLGTLLFSFAVIKTLSKQVADKIDDALRDMSTKAMTRATVDHVRVLIIGQVEAMPNIEIMEPKRVVDVKYRNQTFSAKINSLSQHVSLCVAAAWKSQAVMEGSLPPMWAEKLLFPNPPVMAAGHVSLVDGFLCAGARLARENIDKNYLEEEGTSGSACLQSLRPKFAKCSTIDGEFATEVMLMECLCGDGSAMRLTDQILAVLPLATKTVAVEEALQALTAISHSNLFKLASKPAQAKMILVLKWLAKIMDNRPPEFQDAHKDEGLQRIISRFGFFCFHEQAGGSGVAKRTFGTEALRHIVADAKKLADVGCKLNDIMALKIWVHLIPGDLQEEAGALVKHVEDTVVSMQMSKSSKPKKATKDAAVAEAMALFS